MSEWRTRPDVGKRFLPVRRRRGRDGAAARPFDQIHETSRFGKKVLAILNATPAYRALFGDIFPAVKAGAPIDFFMFGKAIAEFEFTLYLPTRRSTSSHEAIPAQ